MKNHNLLLKLRRRFLKQTENLQSVQHSSLRLLSGSVSVVR